MQRLKLKDLERVTAGIGGIGGGISPPKDPPRGDEKTEQSTNTDGSYQPATLPAEPDEG
ncbi:hypothetical protein [Pseudoalteromonas sp. MTN2-4]|uniref:hypothetical protein n=1 Tax=Pseudoalteromonas sp. MTN2-4 TaxID=3056555 RepID=UPI0036F29F73